MDMLLELSIDNIVSLCASTEKVGSSLPIRSQASLAHAPSATRVPQLRSRVTEALEVIAQADAAEHDSEEEASVEGETSKSTEVAKEPVCGPVAAAADGRPNTNDQANTSEVVTMKA